MELDTAAQIAQLNKKREGLARAVEIMQSPSRIEFKGETARRHTLYRTFRSEKEEFNEVTTLLRDYYKKKLAQIEEKIKAL